MPPKRRTSGITPSNHQSTLTFHGASNRVTKSGTRAQQAKKNIIDEPAAKKVEPDVADVSTAEDDAEPAAVAAPVIEQAELAAAAQQTPSTPEEDEARKISDARIKAYWNAKDSKPARKAPRVHQKDLSVHEKILREFDISAQYGPSVGIARLQRWKRAHRLNLEPPIEVLAVLLKEQEEEDNMAVQISRVDELLNSHNVELEIGGA